MLSPTNRFLVGHKSRKYFIRFFCTSKGIITNKRKGSIMKYLIIGSHPYNGSFAAGLTERIKGVLTENSHEVKHIDLVADGFNPVMTGEDLRLWGQGQFADKLVGKYKAMIENADVLVFPFPIWWGIMPAVLKGFFDKVFLPGFTYKYGEQGQLVGLMTDKKAVVISTMETPNDVFNSYFNNPIEGALIKDTLGTCGIEVIRHFAIDHIVSGGRENAEKRMNEVVDFFKTL